MTTPDRIEKEVVLRAPVSRVWRAITDHEEFGRWFGVKLERPFVAGQTVNGTFDMALDEERMMEHQRRVGVRPSKASART